MYALGGGGGVNASDAAFNFHDKFHFINILEIKIILCNFPIWVNKIIQYSIFFLHYKFNIYVYFLIQMLRK